MEEGKPRFDNASADGKHTASINVWKLQSPSSSSLNRTSSPFVSNLLSGCAELCKVQDKTAVHVTQARRETKFGLRGWQFHVAERRDIGLVDFKWSWSDYSSEALYRIAKNLHFFIFSMIPASGKDVKSSSA